MGGGGGGFSGNAGGAKFSLGPLKRVSQGRLPSMTNSQLGLSGNSFDFREMTGLSASDKSGDIEGLFSQVDMYETAEFLPDGNRN
mmetsp:Transcript_26478/g.48625  ORF Transcript_26478/g.48625 Transcript_26478/m.48625 type:complete len:85 (+) Transcript_26478:2-256(+)